MYNHGDELSERKKLILKAIIDAHVTNGEPVGSKYLTSNKQITLSSATIRNEMAELEELGYLEQPHTSAGRIPSERGYRFYVNSLMESYRLTSSELKALGGVALEMAVSLCILGRHRGLPEVVIKRGKAQRQVVFDSRDHLCRVSIDVV